MMWVSQSFSGEVYTSQTYGWLWVTITPQEEIQIRVYQQALLHSIVPSLLQLGFINLHLSQFSEYVQLYTLQLYAPGVLFNSPDIDMYHVPGVPGVHIHTYVQLYPVTAVWRYASLRTPLTQAYQSTIIWQYWYPSIGIVPHNTPHDKGVYSSCVYMLISCCQTHS